MEPPRLLVVARVVRAHGVKGELSCEIVTDFPERFRKTERVFLSPDEGRPKPDRPKRPRRAGPSRDASTPPGAGGDPSAGGEGQDDGRPASERAGEPPAVETTDGAAVGTSAPETREYAVERARLAPHARGVALILRLAGLTDRDEAEALRGWLVQVPENEAWTLPEGRYYWHQIIGLRAVTADGRALGTVADILETGANDVYVVAREGGELLVPAIKDVVKEIAPERGELVVELLPGME
jgi:16S rRNA processing protein RimM